MDGGFTNFKLQKWQSDGWSYLISILLTLTVFALVIGIIFFIYRKSLNENGHKLKINECKLKRANNIKNKLSLKKKNSNNTIKATYIEIKILNIKNDNIHLKEERDKLVEKVSKSITAILIFIGFCLNRNFISIFKLLNEDYLIQDRFISILGLIALMVGLVPYLSLPIKKFIEPIGNRFGKNIIKNKKFWIILFFYSVYLILLELSPNIILPFIIAAAEYLIFIFIRNKFLK